jgi:hypothetical protein
VAIKFRHNGTDVEVIGFNRADGDMIDRCALHDKAECQTTSASLH